jgi:phosphoglycolate phosphatase
MAGRDKLRGVAAVLFDLDGTLLDSLPGIRHSAEAAFAECGLAMGEVELRGLIGPPIRVILSRMGERELSEGELDALERAFRVSYDSEGWKMTPHYAGAAEALRAMQAVGKRLFVVSNKPRHISVRILEAEGTLGLFEEVVTRDSREPAFAGKVEMMRYLMQKWEIAAAGSLMVGDTIEDAEAAFEVGMRFCLMSHGYGEVPEEAGFPVAFRLDHFSELMPGDSF